MTSSYRDPNITAALAYQAEQEQRRKAQEQPSFLDIAGRTALGLGAAALAGVGIARGLRRNAVKPVSVEDLSATAEKC
jgi:TnpA family transposase